jgi:hypothetical protein
VRPDRAYGKIRWEDFLRSEMGTQIDLLGAEGVTR